MDTIIEALRKRKVPSRVRRRRLKKPRPLINEDGDEEDEEEPLAGPGKDDKQKGDMRV